MWYFVIFIKFWLCRKFLLQNFLGNFKIPNQIFFHDLIFQQENSKYFPLNWIELEFLKRNFFGIVFEWVSNYFPCFLWSFLCALLKESGRLLKNILKTCRRMQKMLSSAGKRFIGRIFNGFFSQFCIFFEVSWISWTFFNFVSFEVFSNFSTHNCRLCSRFRGWAFFINDFEVFQCVGWDREVGWIF